MKTCCIVNINTKTKSRLVFSNKAVSMHVSVSWKISEHCGARCSEHETGRRWTQRLSTVRQFRGLYYTCKILLKSGTVPLFYSFQQILAL